MLHLGELAQSRGFVRLLVCRLFGGAANQMMFVAVGWQMYELTGSAWDLGLIGLFQFAPVLLLTLVAGHAADRFNRAHIVAAAVALQTVCAGILLAATLGASLSRELLIGVSVLLGVATTFQRPAQGSLVGSIVPPRLLARAMALSASVFTAAVIGGPALAGALFALGAGAVYGVALASLVTSFLLALRIDYEFVPSGGRGMTTETLLAGVRYVRSNRTLLGAISLDLMAVLLGGRRRCCRSTRRTSCTWALRVSGSCAPRLPSGHSRCPSRCRARRSAPESGSACWQGSPCTAPACWCSGCRRASCCPSLCSRFPAPPTW